jgi:hypothetical protein
LGNVNKQTRNRVGRVQGLSPKASFAAIGITAGA